MRKANENQTKNCNKSKNCGSKSGQNNPKTASKGSFYSPDDPDGSYTGVAKDGGRPIQDADDL